MSWIILRSVLACLVFIIGNKFAVEKYADWKIGEMQKIGETGNDDGASLGEVPKPSELRLTVNKRSGLVENLVDRRAWNQWISSSSSRPRHPSFIPPGEYLFAYRSYVNYEESGAIRKRLLHLSTLIWSHVQPSPGIITISPTSNDGDALQIVTNEEIVRFRWSTLLVIQWTGHWDRESQSIQWTDSSLTIYQRTRKHPWWKNWKPISMKDVMDAKKASFCSTEIILRPEKSEELRKIPWEMIKEEDGMIAFRRGDVGTLVYDSKALMSGKNAS